MDSFQKRMSATLLLMGFRGGFVDPQETGFTQGNRQAAAFSYSGILARAPAPVVAASSLRGRTPIAALVSRGGMCSLW